MDARSDLSHAVRLLLSEVNAPHKDTAAPRSVATEPALAQQQDDKSVGN